MRILIIHNRYQHTGGEDVVVEQEAKHLSESHEVKVYQIQNEKGLKGYRQYLMYPFNWAEAKKIGKLIDQFKPTIVHLHNMHYALGPWVIRLIKNRKVPIVITLHNFRLICPSATLFHDGNIFRESIAEDFPWTAVKKKVLERSFLKTFWTAMTYWLHKKIGTFSQVDRFILLSEFSRDIFRKAQLNIPEKKFSVKPNFVNNDRPKMANPNDDFVYIGRLSDEKGILPLLHAWKATDYRIKVFGTGPLVEEVQSIAQHSENIRFYGHQDKTMVQEHISTCSAVIVPSLCYESMPLAVLEAFALGIPVLASNIGILSEMVVPLYTGLLFDPHNHSQLVKTVAEWQNLPVEKLEEIRNNCRKEYEEKYSRPRVMQQLEGIYEEVLTNSKLKRI